MARAYGVWHRAGLTAWNIARPAVFLIDQDARISYSFIGDDQREYPSQDEIVAAASTQ
jgi:peroxiredoxin